MKTLHIQKVKGLAGSEKYFLELLPKLNESGVPSVFVCIYELKDKEKISHFLSLLEQKKIKTHCIGYKNGWSIITLLKRLKRIIKNTQPEIVHSHLIHADFWCALLKSMKQFSQPLVSTKHGYDEGFIAHHGFNADKIIKNRYYKIAQWSEKRIDYSFAVSKGLQDLFINARISKADKIEVIHHGFNLFDKHILDSADYRKSKHQIIVVGRIIPFKGHMKLFSVLDLIKKNTPDFHLLILGDGDEKLMEELKQKAKEQDCEKNVSFLGFINKHIEQYLFHSDIMVVPSISEGFGLVFLEAMNAKIPLIGFDVAATNEIIENEKTGILIRPYNTNELAEKITHLLHNEELRNTLAENAYEKRKNYFSLKRMVNETIIFYKTVLKNSTN